MDIYHYLQQDHQKVAGLMDKIMATKDLNKRETLFDEMKKELELHADTEEATFYKALEKQPKTEDAVEHAHEEHDKMRKLIATLEDLPVDDDTWLTKFEELKDYVAHHVEEEEGPLFDKAKKVLTEAKAKELLEDIQTLKREALEEIV